MFQCNGLIGDGGNAKFQPFRTLEARGHNRETHRYMMESWLKPVEFLLFLLNIRVKDPSLVHIGDGGRSLAKRLKESEGQQRKVL